MQTPISIPGGPIVPEQIISRDVYAAHPTGGSEQPTSGSMNRVAVVSGPLGGERPDPARELQDGRRVLRRPREERVSREAARDDLRVPAEGIAASRHRGGVFRAIAEPAPKRPLAEEANGVPFTMEFVILLPHTKSVACLGCGALVDIRCRSCGSIDPLKENDEQTRGSGVCDGIVRARGIRSECHFGPGTRRKFSNSVSSLRRLRCDARKVERRTGIGLPRAGFL